jgi:hypothetical protein
MLLIFNFLSYFLLPSHSTEIKQQIDKIPKYYHRHLQYICEMCGPQNVADKYYKCLEYDAVNLVHTSRNPHLEGNLRRGFFGWDHHV